MGYGSCAAYSFQGVVPCCLHIIAYWSNGSYAGYYNSFQFHSLSVEKIKIAAADGERGRLSEGF